MLEIKEKILHIYLEISLSNKIEKNTHFTLNFFEKIVFITKELVFMREHLKNNF